MPAVRAKENESFDGLYRRFRRLVEKANILAELRKRSHHQKGSEVRKREKVAAVKREQKRKIREKQASQRDRKRYGNLNISPKVIPNLQGEAANNNSAVDENQALGN